MSVAIITGAGGLVGSAVAKHLIGEGMTVVGVDNDTRGALFGPAGSVRSTIDDLIRRAGYLHREGDIRDRASVGDLFRAYGPRVALVVHCAAQPAHDSPDPLVDWDINAGGTVNVLDATLRHSPGAQVIVMSTIKVYGQWPNRLPLQEHETRWEINARALDFEDEPASIGAGWDGVRETMSIDGSEHSIFGASKTAADVMAQEYAHAHGLQTTILRPGCLTGPSHAATEQHGFLGHLVRCVAAFETYRVQGTGKQVRDQLHVDDVVSAIDNLWRFPPPAGSVFNLGGGRATAVSVLEALALAEQATGRDAVIEFVPPRSGDHRWWVTDTQRFRAVYPSWSPQYDVEDIVREIAERWA